MTDFDPGIRHRLRLKSSGVKIAWLCVFLNHRYGSFESDGWQKCKRNGCTSWQQWTRDLDVTA